jgi:flotillin
MFSSFPDWFWLALVPGAVLTLVFGTIAFVRAHLHICEPNEVLIFSGRKRKTADGRDVGFRVVFGGRALRLPILEEVKKMDMTLISVPMAVSGAYSEGGIPLSVSAIANVKIASDPILVNNAIERFLDKSREEVARVAKETLEGHLRGVLATMTPEEVNDDRLKFADRLSEEAGPDLAKLGLQLDTLKIQQVADDRSYLDSIGRKQIAHILSAAEVAESNAVRQAEEAEAAANARGEVARTRAHANVLQKQNELRQLKAELDATARSEEERAEQAAFAARAQAEAELQTIRAELEQLRLTADVTIPADIERRVSELLAEGDAAAIAAKGEALALALSEINAAWKACGEDAADMVVVQNIDEIFARVTQAAAAVQARRVSLLDSGDGSTVATYVDAYPATVQVLLDRIATTFGIDVSGVLRGAMETRRDTTPPTSGDAEAA